MKSPPSFRLAAAAGGLLFFVVCYVCLSLETAPVGHGNVHTDERAIIGARQLVREGFSRLSWTQVTDGRGELGFQPVWYPRHPSGGVVLLGAQLKLGLRVGAARWLPLLLSTIGLLAFAAGIRRLTGSDAFGLATGALLATYAPYYLLADALQLYSYALFVKSLGFLGVAASVAAAPDRRLRGRLLAGLAGFLGVAFCGLETLPALGLFSFVAPLLLTAGRPARRLRAACATATFCGGGMALGWLWRLQGIAELLGTDVLGALDHLRAAVVHRSVSELPEMKHGRDYLEELVYRFGDYGPLHLGLLVLGLLVLALSRRSGARWPHVGVGLAVLAAEGPYFFVMRQHVIIHPHTAVHLGYALAVGAAGGLWMLRGLGTTARARTAITAAVLAVLAVGTLVFPLAPYGNVRGREQGRRVRESKPRFDSLGTVVPEDAIVVIGSERADWLLRRLCSGHGRTFIALKAGVPPRPDEILGVAARTGRPLFTFAEVDDASPLYRTLLANARLVECAHRVALFALTGYDEDALPPDLRALTREQLHDLRLEEPRPGSEAVGALRYPLVRRSGNGVVLRVAPRRLGGRTVTSLDLPPPHHRTRRLQLDVEYAPAAGKDQPDLELSARPLGGDEAPPAPEGRFLLRPDGASRRLELDLPPGSTTRRLLLELRRAPGADEGGGARFLLRGVTVELR